MRVRTLEELQALDEQIVRIEEEIGTLRKGDRLWALKQDVERTQSLLVRADEQIAHKRQEQKRLNDEITTLGNKIEGETRRLYGGSVTNPKELRAIQAEVESLGRRRDSLETQQIEIEQWLERADSARAKLAEDLASKEDALSSEAQMVRTKLDELGQRLTEARERQEKVASSVEGDALALYKSLRNRVGIRVVVELDESICQGCYVELPAEDVDKMVAEEGDALFRCPHCERILVVKGRE